MLVIVIIQLVVNNTAQQKNIFPFLPLIIQQFYSVLGTKMTLVLLNGSRIRDNLNELVHRYLQ